MPPKIPAAPSLPSQGETMRRRHPQFFNKPHRPPQGEEKKT